MPKRRRACEACHSLKARCEPSAEDENVCERCVKFGHDCVPAPRKLQKDRIAELEAQVQALTKALEAQGISAPPPPAKDVKKRKLVGESEGELQVDPVLDPSPVSATGSDLLVFIDARVSEDFQQQVLAAYDEQVVKVLPLIHSGYAYFEGTSLDLEALRNETPFLLLAILAFPTACVLDAAVQHELVGKALEDFAHKIIAAGERSLELVQALLLATFWYRARPGFKHATILQLIQHGVIMASDLGISGPQAPYIPGSQISRLEAPTSMEARRTWLACFIATSAVTTIMRLPDPCPWTLYHRQCLDMLRGCSPMEGDRLFCEIVEGEELCHRIVTELQLCDPTRLLDLTDANHKALTLQLKTAVDDWTMRIPPDLDGPTLSFWRHMALIYLSEPVLHTEFNKSTFSPPFFAEKVVPSEFPNPIVTTEHIETLYSLKDACHGALDVGTNLNAQTAIHVSSLLYSPRILYALLILIKLYVAITAPGNTCGISLTKNELRVEYYLHKLRILTAQLLAIDIHPEKRCLNTRIISAHSSLGSWFEGYSRIVKQYEEAAPKDYSTSLLAFEHLRTGFPSTNTESDANHIPEDDFLFGSLFADELIAPDGS